MAFDLFGKGVNEAGEMTIGIFCMSMASILPLGEGSCNR
jgi:hypothetical protein